jgi:RHS repeat-associated protein
MSLGFIVRRSTISFLTGLIWVLAPSAWADDLPTSGLAIDGPSTLAGSELVGGNLNIVADIDPSTGAARTSVAFALPTPRGAVAQQLGIEYRSTLAVGIAGPGWTLSLPSVERKGAAAFPKFFDDPSGRDVRSRCGNDVLIPQIGALSCADKYEIAGKPQVPICVIDGQSLCSGALTGERFPDELRGWMYFRSEIDDGNRAFWSPDRETWIVQTRSGVTSVFGKHLDLLNTGDGVERSSALFRVEPRHPVAPTGLPNSDDISDIYRWNLIRRFDAAGNGVAFQWAPLAADQAANVEGMLFLTDVYDTAPASFGQPPLGTAAQPVRNGPDEFAHHAHLVWSAPNEFSRSAIESPIWRAVPPLRLLGLDITSKTLTGDGPRELVRRYHLGYDQIGRLSWPTLVSVQLEGRCPTPIAENADGLLPDTDCERLPPTTFGYTFSGLQHEMQPGFGISRPDGPVATKDADGDGLPELMYLKRDPADPNNDAIEVDRRAGGGMSLSTGMEDRQPGGTGRVAKIADIAPGAPHVVYGDFLHNGQINAIFVNPSDVDLTATFEIYTLDMTSSKWKGFGPFPAPPFFPKTGWRPSSNVFEGAGRLVAIDVDGDGLNDLLLKTDFIPEGKSSFVDAWQPYLTATGADGTVQPLAERGGMGCIPHHVATGAQMRLMADFDGDGLLDLIEIENTDGRPFFEWTMHVWKGRGDGRFGLATAASPDPCSQAAGGDLTLTVVAPEAFGSAIVDKTVVMDDVTGDGLADIVVASENGLALLTHSLTLTNGDHFFSKSDEVTAQEMRTNNCVPEPPPTNGGAPGKFDPSRIALLSADVDARGVNDLVVVTGFGGDCVVRFAPGDRPGLLNSIRNGLGAETAISYTSAAALAKLAEDAHTPWKRHLPIAAQLVSSIETRNGLDGAFALDRQTRYEYAHPVWDVRERLFLGFEQVTSIAHGVAGAPGVSTRTTFLTRTCPESDEHQPCEPTADYALRVTRGLPGAVEKLNEAGTVHLQTTLTAYTRTAVYQGMDGRVVRSVKPREINGIVWDPEKQTPTSREVELMPSDVPPEPGTKPPPFATINIESPAASDPARSVLRSFDYDGFGNTQKLVNWGEIDQGGTPVSQPIVTQIGWSIAASETEPDRTGWLWRPASYVLGYGDEKANLVTTSRSYQYGWYGRGLLRRVDGMLVGTQALFRHDAGFGIAPPPPTASHDGQVFLAAFSYDAFGNVAETDEPNGRCVRLIYDDAYSQLPIITATPPNCSPGSSTLGSAREFDRGLGVVTRTAGADGRLFAMKYDGFGRIIEIDQPDPVKLGETSPFPAVTVDWSQAFAGPIPAIHKIHLRRVSGPAPDPTYAEKWVYFDSVGTPVVTFDQSDSADTWIASEITERAPNGLTLKAFEPTAFSGSDATAFSIDPPPGRAASFTYDELGRKLSSTTIDNETTTFKQTPAEFSVEVRDSEQLLSSGPHAGAFTTFRVDGFGRLVGAIQHTETPARDVIFAMFYEASGELSTLFQGDASFPSKGSFITHVYDTLGRRVRTVEPNTAADVVIDGKTLSESAIYAYNDNGDLVGTSDARGCGKNFFYDQVGRLIAEDFSPCERFQPPYSPPNFTTGEGVEVFNVYDVPLSPSGTSSDRVYVGRLTATFDLAQKTEIVLDARGRATAVRRQIAALAPSPPVPRPFGSRYAPRVYEQKLLAYDEAGRVLAKTTGAQSPELAPADVGSWIKSNFYLRGAVQSVTSSYGDLITSETYDSYGAVRNRVMGDPAGTQLIVDYNEGHAVKRFQIARAPGPWLPKSPLYTPPLPADPNTLQGILTDLTFGYDHVRNPVTISDAAAATDWPAGARPLASRAMSYDDAYRLTQVDSRYAGPDPSVSDDVAVSPFAAEEAAGSRVFPRVDLAPNRVRQETFDYSFIGDVITADDDAHLFDRSTGALSTTPGHPNQVGVLTQANAKATVTYDAAGNVTSVQLTRAAPCEKPCPVRYDYAWDEAGRLGFAARSDSVGNDPPKIAIEIGYAYDAVGARRLKGVFDPQGRLATITADVFDTLQLENTTFDSATGDYVDNATVERVRLISPSGMLGTAFSHAPDIPSGMASFTRVFLSLPDALGSTSFVIDKETSELVERTTWQAEGVTEADYRPERWGHYRADLRHTGHQDESEVGLLNFGARYYAPMLGRFLSTDPLTVHAMGGDMNPYAFARGSPLRFVDPVGLDECDVFSMSCEPPPICIAVCFAGGDGGGGGAPGTGGGGSPVGSRGSTVGSGGATLRRLPDGGVVVSEAPSTPTITGYYIPDNRDRYLADLQDAIAFTTTAIVSVGTGVILEEAVGAAVYAVLVGNPSVTGAVVSGGANLGRASADKAMQAAQARTDFLARGLNIAEKAARQRGDVALLRVAKPIEENGQIIGYEFRDLISGSPSVVRRLPALINKDSAEVFVDLAERQKGAWSDAEFNLVVRVAERWAKLGWQPVAGASSPNLVCPWCGPAIVNIGGVIVEGQGRMFFFPSFFGNQ